MGDAKHSHAGTREPDHAPLPEQGDSLGVQFSKLDVAALMPLVTPHHDRNENHSCQEHRFSDNQADRTSTHLGERF